MVKDIRSIIYLVENKTRDLDAILYFTESILKKNYKIKIHILAISKLNFKILFKLGHSIVIWPHPRHFLINWSYFLGNVNIIHETEGIPYKKEQLFHSSKFLHRFTISQVWCWGSNQQKILQERFSNSFLSNKIINTGSIRYEFAKNKIKEPLLKQKKPKALIATNYNILNPKYQTLYKEMMDHKKNYKLETSDPNKFLQWMISETERRALFIEKIKLEKDSLSKFDVELRPHPYEAKEYYSKEKLSPLKFEIQNFDEDISDAISNSQIVIATGCQTVLDSIVNGKPVFGDSQANYNLWDDFVIPLESLSNYKFDNETLKEVAEEQLKNSISKGLDKWLNNLIYEFDYSYLINLLNCKYRDNKIRKVFIFILFFLLKTSKFLNYLFRIILKNNSSNKNKKQFNKKDILDSHKRICPDVKYKNDYDFITFYL